MSPGSSAILIAFVLANYSTSGRARLRAPVKRQRADFFSFPRYPIRGSQASIQKKHKKKERIMKLSRIATGLVTVLACSILHAAESADLKATIPFEFLLGQKVMPAGEYRIIQRSDGLITVREEGGHHITQAFFTLPEFRREKWTSGLLVFNRYGDSYFLSKVWAPYSHDGRSFPKSKQEKELASRASPAKTADVAVARK
jgi:hypothetical protein